MLAATYLTATSSVNEEHIHLCELAPVPVCDPSLLRKPLQTSERIAHNEKIEIVKEHVVDQIAGGKFDG
jgi:hypothetical protein